MLMVFAPLTGARAAVSSAVASPGSVAWVGGRRSADDFGTVVSSMAVASSEASCGNPSINSLLLPLLLGRALFLATRGITSQWQVTDPQTRFRIADTSS